MEIQKEKLQPDLVPVLTAEAQAVINDFRSGIEEYNKTSQGPTNQRTAKLFNNTYPRHICLTGPSGTGKTLTAKWIALTTNVTFMHTTGCDFNKMLVKTAKEQAPNPCFIFIDEVHNATLNPLLRLLDGYDSPKNVFVMTATNRPDTIDKALIDRMRKVVLDLPDEKARIQILQNHAHAMAKRANMQTIFENDTQGSAIAQLAAMTEELSGRDLKTILNDAARIAARKESLLNAEIMTQAARNMIDP